MRSNHFVSLVLPIYNEERHIAACLNSVLEQDYPKEQMEILLIDGNSNDGTLSILEEFCEQDARFKIINNPKKIVPCGLNKGIKASRGDVIVRMDCHCVYPYNYVSVLGRKLFELDAANVGAVLNTLPANDSDECRAIAICSSHPLGVGLSFFRIGETRTIIVDTVPFGCFRREIFDQVGYYDEEMERNEDEEMNGRIAKAGGKIYLIPGVIVDYKARSSMENARKMYYHYGLYKPLVNTKVGRAVTIRQFIPGLFVVGNILGIILGFFSKFCLITYLAVMAIYFLLGFAVGLLKSIEYKRPALFFLIPYTLLCIHLSYGIGYLQGLAGLLGMKKLSYQVDR